MNVQQGTIDALYEIIGECFKYNRWLDRFVSVMGVQFAMNKTSGLIHQNIAHYFPKVSDTIGEKCLENYNITVEYASTPEGKENYLDPKDMFEQLESKIIDFQNMLIKVVNIAQDNKDIQVYADLLDVIKDFNKIVGQVILLNDKAKVYPNMMSFDHDIDSFWIL